MAERTDPGPLFKTTIVIWSREDPGTLQQELEDLAREASTGDAYCSQMDTVRVESPAADKDWNGTVFFEDAVPASESDADSDIDPPIRAWLCADDGGREIEFDAGPWFATARDSEIVAVVSRPMPGEATDAVALASQAHDVQVAGVFAYIAARNDGREDNDIIGFSCRVDSEAAMAWLQLRRPGVAGLIKEEGER